MNPDAQAWMEKLANSHKIVRNDFAGPLGELMDSTNSALTILAHKLAGQYIL